MTTRLTPGRPLHALFPAMTAAILLLSCPAHAGWTHDDVAKYPIGHMKIIDAEDDKVYVEARCVPAKDLLEALAERTGKPIDFNLPVRTYVTVFRPWKPQSAAGWLDEVARRAGCLARLVDGRWQVNPPIHWRKNPTTVDPSQTEEEIIAQFAAPKPGYSVPEDGIRGGVLILAGHYIPAPYEVTVHGEEHTAIHVKINGVTIRTLKKPLTQEEIDARIAASRERNKPPELPESGQFDDYVLVLRYCKNLYATTVKEVQADHDLESAIAAAKKAVFDFLGTQHLIENVEPVEVNGATVYVLNLTKGEIRRVHLFPYNFDYATGGLLGGDPLRRPPSGPPISRMEAAEKEAKAWAGFLARGVVIRPSPGSESNHPGEGPKYLADVLALTAHRSVLMREALFMELVRDRFDARQMAVNLPADAQLLLPELRRLQGENETSSLPPDPQ